MTKASWIAALIVFFPLSFHRLDYRGQLRTGLKLKLFKSSPAYAALEDLSEPFDPPKQINAAREVVRLAAGQVRIRPLEKFAVTRLALKTLVLKKAFQPQVAPQVPVKLESADGNLLPLEERKKILVQYYKNQPLKIPMLRDEADRLIKEQVKEVKDAENTRVVVGETTGTQIIVTKPASFTPPTPTNTASLFKGQTPPPAVDEPNITVASVPTLSSVRLKGELEMRNGLAFLGEDTFFTLHRVSHGVSHETGRVWVSDARFEINVKEARGDLVAELYSKTGGLLGRGTLALDQMLIEKDAPDFSGLRIELSPVIAGVAARVASAHSYGKNTVLVANSLAALDQSDSYRKISTEGVVEDRDRARHSTYVAHAFADKHWPTLSVGTESEQKEVRLFPESMVKSFLDLVAKPEERASVEQAGLVFGIVTKDGKPVSHVSVELAGSYNPMYFNEIFLPDEKLMETTKSGMFGFLRVRSGVQAIRVRYDGKVYPAQVFPTAERHVSYLEIRLEPNRSVNVGIEDAFQPEKRLSAHIRFVGVDEDVIVKDQQNLEYSSAAEFMTLEADAGPDYELARVQVVHGKNETTIPMIKREWFERMVEIKQINLLPHRGSVVGFVTDQPFIVQVSGYEAEPPVVVYFDSQGRLVDGTSGPAGGGFIVFNAPLGLQTLYVKPLSSSQTFTQVFVAEPEFIHVLKYSFGAY